jgi:hypothetical protein
MKTPIILLAVLMGVSMAGADQTNVTPVRVQKKVQTQTQTQAQIMLPAPTPPAPTLQELKPNEIVVGTTKLSGIGPQVAKAKNPLQLINPFAPPEYGSGQDNVVRAPAIERRSPFLKFFSFDF